MTATDKPKRDYIWTLGAWFYDRRGQMRRRRRRVRIAPVLAPVAWPRPLSVRVQ